MTNVYGYLSVIARKNTTNRSKQTLDKMRNALIQAGFKSNIIYDDNISSNLANLGLEKGCDYFGILMRAAIWEKEEIGKDYLDNIKDYWHVLRITPKKPIKTKRPWPAPTLHVRETDQTEINLLPNARYD